LNRQQLVEHRLQRRLAQILSENHLAVQNDLAALRRRMAALENYLDLLQEKEEAVPEDDFLA
jgi:polyhydroxyalkanoate synthesis regulator phasin